MTSIVNDLLPYWTVDGKVYYNQFETWMAIGDGDSSRAQFNFYDQSFDTVDWTQDPPESWDSLVQQRCLQLRDKYKHLCLLYSGGRDSHHLLRSFAKYNILLDEIIRVDFTVNPLKRHEAETWMMPLAPVTGTNALPMVPAMFPAV